MKPIKFPEHNCVYAEDQPDYIPLPVYKVHESPQGEAISCWKLSWRERIKLLFTGKLWWCTSTFHKPLQPQLPSVNKWDLLNKECFTKLKENENKNQNRTY